MPPPFCTDSTGTPEGYVGRAGFLEDLAVLTDFLRESEDVFSRMELSLIGKADRSASVVRQVHVLDELGGQSEAVGRLHLITDLFAIARFVGVDVR